MTLRYYRLSDDLDAPGRWELGTPVDSRGQDAGSWLFMTGETAQLDDPLRIPIYQAGKSLDFSLADAGAIPVVTSKVATVLSSLAPDDVQLFPVEVEGQPEPYFLVNVTRLVRCIDDAASEEVRYWKPEDGRPEKVGRYRAVAGMRIDPAKVGNARVFRTWGWTVALIVSEKLKEAFERAGVSGMKFKDVTRPSAPGMGERDPNRQRP